MSTGWITDPVIPFDELRKADLGDVWVAQDAEGTTADEFALTDGERYIWAYRNDDGDATFTVWAEATNEQPGGNPIRDAVSEAFDVEWISEHMPEFWEGTELEDENEDENEEPEGTVTVHSDRIFRQMAAKVAGSKSRRTK